jgi:hypothetical protein
MLVIKADTPQIKVNQAQPVPTIDLIGYHIDDQGSIVPLRMSGSGSVIVSLFI